jgi:hypothetical protein
VQKYLPFVTDDIVQAGVALAGGGANSVIGSCGVFSGGLMVLSARLSPRSDPLSEKELEQLSYAQSKFAQFRNWFISEFGSTACRDVQFRTLGRVYNIMDEQEFQKFIEYQRESGKYCRDIAAKAALKVAEIISQEK